MEPWRNRTCIAVLMLTIFLVPAKAQHAELRAVPRRDLPTRVDGNANCARVSQGLAARRLKDGSSEPVIEALPLSKRAVLYLFRVRCSANRSGDPIVAEKRPDDHAINHPELQAWIEIAHRPLIEVNDAARR